MYFAPREITLKDGRTAILRSPDPVKDAAELVQYLYVGNNAVNWVDPLGLVKLPFPGFIHEAVLLNIKAKHPDYYLEQKNDYNDSILWGRADVISPSGEVWEV